VQWAAAAGELLAHGRESGAFLGDRVCEGGGAAEVVGEGKVDHPVGLGGAGAERGQAGEVAAEGLGADVLEGRRGGAGAGEREDRVAVTE
jgi:hypothetical protein